jgi:hypothetical protein
MRGRKKEEAASCTEHLHFILCPDVDTANWLQEYIPIDIYQRGMV